MSNNGANLGFEQKLWAAADKLRSNMDAVVHMDYFSNGHTQIDIFLDRVEISNPGGLVRGLSRKDFGKVSLPRNPLLMDLMLRTNKVEKIGSGIKRIKDAMKDYGLKVKFQSTGFFTVIFKRTSTPQAVEKPVEKIISLINENPRITQEELSQKTGLTRRGIEWNLQQLKVKGTLKRVGPGKGGHWEIIR